MESLETNQNVKDLLPALERWEDDIRELEEITEAAMLNEATKKDIVIKMAPPELAPHLRLNADRYNTYTQMKWQVLSYVSLKLPSQPTTSGLTICGKAKKIINRIGTSTTS